MPFHATLDAALTCAVLPAQLRFAVGQSFPFWQVTVVCDDGVVVADILANRLFSWRRTRWLEAVDGLVSAGLTAGAVFAEGFRNTAAYAAATLRLAKRNDAFFQSMRSSIAAFHDALSGGHPPPIDGSFGAMLVELCERIARAAFGTTPVSAAPAIRTSVGAMPDVACTWWYRLHRDTRGELPSGRWCARLGHGAFDPEPAVTVWR